MCNSKTNCKTKGDGENSSRGGVFGLKVIIIRPGRIRADLVRARSIILLLLFGSNGYVHYKITTNSTHHRDSWNHSIPHDTENLFS